MKFYSILSRELPLVLSIHPDTTSPHCLLVNTAEGGRSPVSSGNLWYFVDFLEEGTALDSPITLV